MKRAIVGVFIFIMNLACSGQNVIKQDFSLSTFPISVSCTDSEIECSFFEQKLIDAIEVHNQLLVENILEYIGSNQSNGLIDVMADEYIYNDDGSINENLSGITKYYSNQIQITLNSKTFSDKGLFDTGEDQPTCVIIHELGHALGYRGHNEKSGTLMSEIPNCNSEGWYDDFYNWFQENY